MEVIERHEGVWESGRQNWAAGWRTAPRLLAAQAKLTVRARPRDVDAAIVGYPGHVDIPAAELALGRVPVVFNPLVSLTETLVDDRRRFAPGSPAAADAARARPPRAPARGPRGRRHAGERAASSPSLGGISRVEVCFVGAEERVFRPVWRPPDRFHALFVGKLIPLHGLETILEAARLAPEIPFRVVGSGQLEPLLASAPANVERVPWLEYERLPGGARPGGLRARHLRHGRQGAARDPEQGVPGAGLRDPARDGRHACGARAARARARARCSCRPETPRLSRRRSGGSPRTPTWRCGSPRPAYAAYRTHASEDVLGRRWRGLLERLVERS